MPEQFLLKDIPDALLQEAVNGIKDFTTAFVSGLNQIGSGTFATINGRHGILTAEHVWEAICVRSLAEPMISLVISQEPHRFEIQVRDLLPHLNLGYDRNGGRPDIQFLEIPLAKLGGIKARKSFVNLSKGPEAKIDFALGDLGFVAIAGFPAEFSPEPQVEPSGDYRVSIRGGFVSSLERHWVDGEYDFFETKGDRHAPGVPRSYGGVSGAGVWRVELKKKPGLPIAQARIGRYEFVGVTFLERFVDDVVNDRCFPAVMTIRNRHGLLEETNGKGMHWLPPRTGANKLTAGGSPNRC
jgi:hypothetical protein